MQKNKIIFLSYLIFNSCLSANRYKVAIIGLYDLQYFNIGKYSDINKMLYSQKYFYDCFLYHDTLDKTRPTAWSKILAIKKHIEDYDWICWIDADALIMNFDIKLETLIDSNYDLIITEHPELEWPHTGTLNTGVFLIKNTNWSKNILNRIYEQENFIFTGCWEQDALNSLYFQNIKEYQKHIKVLSQKTMNSHPGKIKSQHLDVFFDSFHGGYQDGDFIIHFFGLGKEKEDLMKEYFYKSNFNKKILQ